MTLTSCSSDAKFIDKLLAEVVGKPGEPDENINDDDDVIVMAHVENQHYVSIEFFDSVVQRDKRGNMSTMASRYRPFPSGPFEVEAAPGIVEHLAACMASEKAEKEAADKAAAEDPEKSPKYLLHSMPSHATSSPTIT
jgi:hypothetical protein